MFNTESCAGFFDICLFFGPSYQVGLQFLRMRLSDCVEVVIN